MNFNYIWPFSLSQRSQRVGAKIFVTLHVSFMSVTHTPNLAEFQKKKLTPLPPDPPPPPSPTLGHDPGDQINIMSDKFYIFHLWEDTQSLV